MGPLLLSRVESMTLSAERTGRVLYGPVRTPEPPIIKGGFSLKQESEGKLLPLQEKANHV